MTVSFDDRKLERQALDPKRAKKELGEQQAKRLLARLADMQAASTLAELKMLHSGRLHPLTGDRLGQLSLDLVHPYRLIFVPDHEPIPRLEDGGLDWSRITSVCVLGIENTHGK